MGAVEGTGRRSVQTIFQEAIFTTVERVIAIPRNIIIILTPLNIFQNKFKRDKYIHLVLPVRNIQIEDRQIRKLASLIKEILALKVYVYRAR